MHEGLRGELQAGSQERWVCPEDAVRDGGPHCSGEVFVRAPEGPAGCPGLTLPPRLPSLLSSSISLRGTGPRPPVYFMLATGCQFEKHMSLI